jgi:hypothetical protein
MRRNGRDAPIPDLRTTIVPLKSSLRRRFQLRKRWSGGREAHVRVTHCTGSTGFKYKPASSRRDKAQPGWADKRNALMSAGCVSKHWSPSGSTTQGCL